MDMSAQMVEVLKIATCDLFTNLQRGKIPRPLLDLRPALSAHVSSLEESYAAALFTASGLQSQH